MAQQLILDILPPPEPTLANLIVGENATVIAAVHALNAGQSLYIWGSDGCGRTHLLKAAALHYQGIYLTAHHASDLQNRLDQETPMPSCVAIDDVNSLDGQGASALFRLYNRWREDASGSSAFRLIVAGDRAPLQLKLREDLRTRLGWGAVYRLYALSDTEKFTALTSYARDRGAPLSAEVVHWLLTHGSRDIRELFGWLDALEKYALARHRPLTLPLLKSMLAVQQTDAQRPLKPNDND
jgi:DnaA family protein